ncbi:hypothetical protein ACHAPJ_012985, partial [Fusarium lateritium]
WTGVVTNIGLDDPTEAPVTRKPGTAAGTEAWGIKFVSIPPTTSGTSVASTTAADASDPTSDSSTRQSNEEEIPTDPSGLSSGAIAGIAVGAVIDFLLLALAAFILLRRKRKLRDVQNLASQSSTEIPKRHKEVHQLDAPLPPRDYYQYDTKNQLPNQTQAWELPG